MCPPNNDGALPVQDHAMVIQPLSGRYRIWPTTTDGRLICEAGIGQVPRRDEAPNPYHEQAVDMFFGLIAPADMPPREQLEVQSAIDKVLRTIQRVYPDASGRQRVAFRVYYVRLFNVARIGLEGKAAPELAQFELAKITADLLEDEGGNVKNAHLRTLGKFAALYSVLPLLVYALVSLSSGSALHGTLARLGIQPAWLKGFCMLWAGCFGGVWLSYGIRKTRITLSDLLVGDEDRMVPQVRLLFAAFLASAIGLMFALGIVDLKLGEVSLSDIVRWPALAFLVGLLLGVGELALPASIGGRAATLTTALK